MKFTISFHRISVLILVLGVFLLAVFLRKNTDVVREGQSDILAVAQKKVMNKDGFNKSEDGGEIFTDKQMVLPAFITENKEILEDFEIQIVSTDKDDEMVTLYKTLSANVQKRLMEKTPIDAVVPNEGKERIFTVRITDGDTGVGISGVSVSLRGGFVGVTDDQGELLRSRKLPRIYDYLYFQAHKIGYTPAFVKKPVFYIEAQEVLIEMTMKKTAKSVATLKANIENDTVYMASDTLTVSFTDTCGLRNVDGSCYEGGAAMLEYQFIHPEDLHQISIPMRALVDGSLKDLESNGMAFINFYSDVGERLQYDGGLAEVCYVVDPDRITAWQAVQEEGKKQGYRYFDKNIGLWKFDESAEITISDGKFCAVTKYVY